MNTNERSLSKTESRLILELEWRGQRITSLDEIQSLLKIREGNARFMAYRLVQKGWFERLRPGVFQLIPAERGREGIADTNPYFNSEVFLQPCFYSFGSASSFYGFTEQTFAEMYLASAKRHRPEEIRSKKYIFAYTPNALFFGFEEVEIFGNKVQMAVPERAILDALDRPEYAGGITEVSRIIRKSGQKIDFDKILKFVRAWNQSALVQRFGFLLDLHQIKITNEIRNELKKLVKPDNKIYLTTRGKWKTPLRLNTEWTVIENVPRDILLENEEGKRLFIFKKNLTATRNGGGSE